MPHSNDVEEAHGASAALSQLISYYSSKPTNDQSSSSSTFLIKMNAVRNKGRDPNQVRKSDVTQGSFELIKAPSPIK